MPNLHIIAGCNGAGKTTASFTILPEIFKVREYVNADSIAANIIARGSTKGDNTILNSELWSIFSEQSNFMEDKSIYLDEFSEKLLEGLRKSFKKLVETSAKLDEELVVRDKDGIVKSVPAKDLLHLVQK